MKYVCVCVCQTAYNNHGFETSLVRSEHGLVQTNPFGSIGGRLKFGCQLIIFFAVKVDRFSLCFGFNNRRLALSCPN